MPSNFTPGFISLHGNQLERLRREVFDWISSNPLAPLEQETFLVQSNGIAEWLKISLAEELGICAATQVMLPARFLWQVYRAVLDSDSIPERSAFERAPLTWRLMQLLPTLLQEPGFEPLARFMSDGDAERRLQLAQRLADLMDQYQVYRADWLQDWTEGRDVTRTARDEAKPLDDGQLWQAGLWRAILSSARTSEPLAGRAAVHEAFLKAIKDGARLPASLPRRVVVFGISALPLQTLQALHAISSRVQVIVAVLNPCRFHWADIISGRELLQAQRRRQPLREGRNLASMELQDLHAHAHPLLAAWGRQGRDFIRMLDEFDDSQARAGQFPGVRMDVFSDEDSEESEQSKPTLLACSQAAIRDLLPLQEHEYGPIAEDDRSIEFHVAHSAQREVEVLHDRLLTLLAEGKGQEARSALQPRDIIVMVPDIQAYAPSIRAVFSQYAKEDKRFIPFALADLRERNASPIMAALDWLLRLPQQRCAQSEIRNLLQVPALARRFGLEEDDLERLAQWMEEAGVRWGLDSRHREELKLGAAGEQNSWVFGLRRMLLGYASGAQADYQGIEPYAEVGGLEADLAGALASLVDRLLHWRAVLSAPATPAQWGTRARDLVAAFLKPADEQEKLTLLKLEQALQTWLEDCASAAFEEQVPLAILREAWLSAVDESRLSQRFASGGVTFCTLMPMRSVPFKLVCLLGMNDGDFPRRAHGSDFDLLALPALSRPGDRSRRDDDRYLMLETLLSAREKLYISWVGRDIRDDTELPPSVLVGQLRDYLQRAFKVDPARLTTRHPLQPFSRRYLEEDGPVTWSDAFHLAPPSAVAGAAPAVLQAGEPHLSLQELNDFLKQPVKYFFSRCLQVAFDEAGGAVEDDEPFALDPLQRFSARAALLQDEVDAPTGEALDALRQRAARLAREGRLPLSVAGGTLQDELLRVCQPACEAWRRLCKRYPQRMPNLHVSVSCGSLLLEDWIVNLRGDGQDQFWTMQSASELAEKGRPRASKMIRPWLTLLAAAAQGRPTRAILVGIDKAVQLEPIEQAQAQAALAGLLAAWQDGLRQPLPVACETALALLDGGDPGKVYDGDDYGARAESGEPCLARLWPTFANLQAESRWEATASRLYRPLLDWCSDATQARVINLEELFPEGGAA